MSLSKADERKLCTYSRFLSRHFYPQATKLETLAFNDPETLDSHLRQIRNQCVSYIAINELLQPRSLTESFRQLSDLAEWALLTALNYHQSVLSKYYGHALTSDGTPMNLIIVAMGKLGARELNASSDIDLVFLYPEEGETKTNKKQKSISHALFFEKLAQAITASLDVRTHEGFVFRVDTRLRPFGLEGPLAISFDFFEQYLMRDARLWERFAWLKARTLTGTNKEQAEFKKMIEPFVFKRYLDYSLFQGLRELHQKIRQEVGERDAFRNIKLGRGGIRELEFFCQVQQIVQCGKNTQLRVSDTLSCLRVLYAENHLNQHQYDSLSAAYLFLRRVEHALQYENDEQTQCLPDNCTALATILGFTTANDFLLCLHNHRDCVAKEFEALLNTPASERTEPKALHPLTQQVLQLNSVKRSKLSQDLLPSLLLRLQQACPREDLSIWLDLFERLAGRPNYFALLLETPALLPLIHTLLAHTPWASRMLCEHPILLDSVIDPKHHPLEPKNWLLQTQKKLKQVEGDTEQYLDVLRHTQQELSFLIMQHEIMVHWPVESVSDFLSYLADVLVLCCLETLWHEELKQTSPLPLAVIAYGRWGGKELGYGSDLDLIFIVPDDIAKSAQMPLVNRLAQKFITWMSTPTSAGICYDIDIRLRPDGGAGVLVSSVNAFAHYQSTQAWTWEHQALTRARYAVGDRQTGLAFERIRDEILAQKPKDSLRSDIVAMRARMSKEKNSLQFNVKHSPGGMIDIEFIVQYLLLKNAHQYPDLRANVGVIQLLERLAAHRLLAKKWAVPLAKAYRLYRAFQHKARLNQDNPKRQALADSSQFAQLSLTVREAWAKILA